MQLYEKKISENGRVRYVPHVESGAGVVELDNIMLATMILTFVIGVIEATQVQLSTHSRHGRELRKLQDSLVDYAKATSLPTLEQTHIEVAVRAWNAAMTETQRGLQ